MTAGGGPVAAPDEKSEPKRAGRLQLLQGAAGIYFFFIQFGRLQDAILKFKTKSGKHLDVVWFVQLVDALCCALLGAVGRRLQGSTPGLPQRLLLCSGAGQVLSKWSFSASLAAGLSFHVATMAKCAKMVPVMLGSLVFGGQTFSFREVAQAAAIVSGTALVTLSEGSEKKGPSSSIKGLLLVLMALGYDGLVGGAQRRIKVTCKEQNKKMHSYDFMFWNNVYMALVAFGFAALRGELRRGVAASRAHPGFFRSLLKLGTCSALGQACIFYTITHFDSVICTGITTTRKLLSVLISLWEGGGAPLSGTGKAGLLAASGGILVQVAEGH